MPSDRVNNRYSVRNCKTCGKSSVDVIFDGRRRDCRSCAGGFRPHLSPDRTDAQRAAHREYAREWRARDGRDRQMETDLQRMYGITIDQYDALAEQQDHGCAVCGGQNVAGRKLSVDHDHATGKVRGLLCNHCNRAIGFLKDDPALMAAAIAYIQAPAMLDSGNP